MEEMCVNFRGGFPTAIYYPLALYSHGGGERLKNTTSVFWCLCYPVAVALCCTSDVCVFVSVSALFVVLVTVTVVVVVFSH